MRRQPSSIWRKVFGVDQSPVVDFTLAEIPSKAQSLVGKMSISGVQPKLSVRLTRKGGVPRLEASGEFGQYILKPQVQAFISLPENEEVCMFIAEQLGVKIPPHCLVSLKDGTLAYVVKRFDRQGRDKIHQEDFAQILGKRDKYDGSVEEIGRKLKEVSHVPGLDVQLFFERVVFSFLLGNGDAHVKNYSILYDDKGCVRLAPAYDLVCSRLVIPNEDESALTIAGKKNNLKKQDFDALAGYLGIPEKVRYDRLAEKRVLMETMVDQSKLSQNFITSMKKIIGERYQKLGFG